MPYRIVIEILFSAPLRIRFFFVFLNTTGDNRIIPRFGKGRRTIKTTYTLHVHVRTKGGEDERSAPSLHGLLISNFTDNGQGASFFYANTLVERRTRVGVWGTGRVDFARLPGPNALFSPFLLLFLSFFSLPFSSFALHIAGRIWFSSHIRIGNRRQLRRGWFYGVFGAKRT